jgi:thymidine kinase
MNGFIGPMFAGKTSTLLSTLEEAEYAGNTVALYTHANDTRYTEDAATAHTGENRPATVLHDTDIDRLKTCEADVIGIDEIQFFPARIAPVLDALQHRGIRILYAGLAKDFRGDPFNTTIKTLLPRTDHLTTLTAVCTVAREDDTICGNPATQTQRFIDGEPAPYNADTVSIGGSEQYAPRCRQHHVVPGHPRHTP